MPLNPSFAFCIFFAIIHLSSLPVKSSNFIQNIVNMQYNPIAINVDTKKAAPSSAKTPLYFEAFANVPVVLINTGQSIHNIHELFDIANISGGPLGNTYQYLAAAYFWTNDTTGITGTTVDREGFPYEIRILYRNMKYRTFGEAVKHPDGLVETVYLYRICSTINIPFIKLTKKFNQVSKAGTFTFVLLGTQIKAAVSSMPLKTTYYSYSGVFVNLKTGQVNKCATVIVFKPDSKYCLTKDQFAAAFDPLKNFQGRRFTNTLHRDNSYTQVSEFNMVTHKIIP